MKKQLIIATLALGAIALGTTNVQAQTATASVTKVDINLASVISIDGGAAPFGLVEFNYPTTASYQAIQTKDVPNSLIVSSTGVFDVKVRAEGANFSNGNDDIAINVLTIRPLIGGTTTMNGTPADVVLATTDEPLMTGNAIGIAQVLDLQYEITAANATSLLFGKPVGNYTQNVTYTATVQ